MARQQKPAKRRTKTHRPKGNINLNLLMRCTAHRVHQELMAEPVSGEHMSFLNTRFWRALELIKEGRPDPDSWSTLGSCLNVALLLCEKGLGEDYLNDVNAALEAIVRARRRGDETSHYYLDPQGINDVAYALELHYQQCQIATHGDIQAAMKAVDERIAQGQVHPV